jgi:hypothetical protein
MPFLAASFAFLSFLKDFLHAFGILRSNSITRRQITLPSRIANVVIGSRQEQPSDFEEN